MKACGGVDVYIRIFLASALVGGEWLASRPCRFTSGERAPDTHWTEGWVGPRAGLDNVWFQFKKQQLTAALGISLMRLHLLRTKKGFNF
jgi:hypothetical protein